jgi:hypothetical protein
MRQVTYRRTRRGLLLLLALLAAPLQAATSGDAFRLSDFRAEGSQLTLRGQSPAADIFVPLSATRQVESATVELYLVNSIALLEERSVVRVNFNGVTVGQIRASRRQPEIVATVDLPAALWEPGFNRLQLAASQQIEAQCASPEAPELWTEVDLYRSQLSVTHRAADAALALGDLSELFGSGVGGHGEVSLLTAPGTDSDALARALPLVSQALALRRAYAPLRVRHASWRNEPPVLDDAIEPVDTDVVARSAFYWPDATADAVHVLVGRRDALAGLLPDALLESIQGAHLSLQRTPAVVVDGETRVPATLRLIVSGDSDAELLTAARTLAEMDDRLNRGPAIEVLARELQPADPELLASHFLQPERRYTLATLGGGADFRGSGTFRHAVDFDLPPDFHVPESASLQLYLDFGYGAQMGPGSSMNLFLNGQLIHGMPLDEPGGQSFRAYRLDVSARQLRGGSNRLTAEATLRPPQSAHPCPGVSDEHLIFQLHDSSLLVLPEAGRAAVLPDLGLMADTAYPYLQRDDSERVRLHVASPDLRGAALTLAGKLAQAAGMPLGALELAGWPQAAPEAGHHVLLGTPEALPEAVFRDWSAALGRSQRWPYRSLNDWRALLAGDSPALSGEVTQRGSVGDAGLMAALANPAGRGVVTVITAADTPSLSARVDALTQPAIWSQLRGDLATWRDIDSPVHTQQVSPGRIEGDPEEPMSALRLWLSNNPWYWAGALLLVLLVGAWVVYRLLLARNREQQAQWES